MKLADLLRKEIAGNNGNGKPKPNQPQQQPQGQQPQVDISKAVVRRQTLGYLISRLNAVNVKLTPIQSQTLYNILKRENMIE